MICHKTKPNLTKIYLIYKISFGLVAYQPVEVIYCQILFINIFQIYMIWFGLVWFVFMTFLPLYIVVY